MSPTERSAPRTDAAAAHAYTEAFVPESDVARTARRRAGEFGVSSISTGTAATLALLTRLVKARHVVEIGTGTGVSALALLSGMEADGVITSIDSQAELQLQARSQLGAEGIPARRARLIAGQALEVLPKLTDGAYDLVFIDADPLEYVEYVAQAQRLLRAGGVLVLHHALWQGKVADPDNEDDEPLIIREALTAVSESEDFTAALLPVGDGLLVAVRS